MNVAMRLADDVIAIDVDAHSGKAGGQTFARLCGELGPLPLTVVSTSRDDGVSGCYLFSLPRGADARGWSGIAGPGIEVCTAFDRYVMAAPSIHPDTGRVYFWRCSDGEPIHPGYVTRAAVAELPQPWLDHLAAGGTAPRSERVSPGDGYAAWLTEHGGGEPCVWAAESGAAALAKVQAARDAGGAYEAVKAATRTLVLGIAEGHQGVNVPLAECRAAYLAAMESRSRKRGAGAVGEWRRLVAGAIDEANGRLGGTAPPAECECHETAGLDAAAFAGRGRRRD
jgi:hypothetical protein